MKSSRVLYFVQGNHICPELRAFSREQAYQLWSRIVSPKWITSGKVTLLHGCHRAHGEWPDVSSYASWLSSLCHMSFPFCTILLQWTWAPTVVCSSLPPALGPASTGPFMGQEKSGGLHSWSAGEISPLIPPSSCWMNWWGQCLVFNRLDPIYLSEHFARLMKRYIVLKNSADVREPFRCLMKRLARGKMLCVLVMVKWTFGTQAECWWRISLS